jgi:hypothetical protein
LGRLRLLLVGAGVIVALPVLAIVVSALTKTVAWQTVGAGRKPYPRVALTFGYSIQKPWGWRDDFRVNFYGGGFQVQLDAPGTELIRVVEQRWLCDGRAVYLKLDTRQNYGSYWTDETAEIIYDFERGEMFTYNGPWLVGWPGNSKERSPTEEEFKRVRGGLEAECHQ